METKQPFEVETKEPFQVVGTTVYQLEFDSYRKGVEQMRNRVYANVQGYRDTPKEELEATARLFAAAPDLLEVLKDVQGMIYAQGLSESQVGVAVANIIAKAQGEAE